MQVNDAKQIAGNTYCIIQGYCIQAEEGKCTNFQFLQIFVKGNGKEKVKTFVTYCVQF